MPIKGSLNAITGHYILDAIFYLSEVKRYVNKQK
jgi:hypothetical protein